MVSKLYQYITGFTHFWHVTIFLSIFAYLSRIFHIIPLFSDLKVYFSRRGVFLSWYGTYNTQKTVFCPTKAPCKKNEGSLVTWPPKIQKCKKIIKFRKKKITATKFAQNIMKIELDLSLTMGKNEFEYQDQATSLWTRYFFFTKNLCQKLMKNGNFQSTHLYIKKIKSFWWNFLVFILLFLNSPLNFDEKWCMAWHI